MEKALPMPHAQQHGIDEAVARFVATDNLPLVAVEKPGFQGLMKHLSPNYSLPKSDHLKELIDQQFKKRQKWVCFLFVL